MNTNTATEYRNLPLAALTESTTTPRHIFEDSALKELAESIRSQGVLSPLLVRPLTDQSFEIVAGARRYRAAQMAEAPTVPVRIVNLTDAEALEAQLIENLQRRDVHPLEEAQGFKALLNLEDPKYSIEQIAAKVGKSPAYCAARVRLTELAAPVVEAFYAEEIGVGHALILAKLQPAQQEQAMANCFREEWNGAGGKAKRILLPVRHLQQWIEHNVLLLLKQAPFNKRDTQLVPAAGSCGDCPKRTGHNKLLFADVSGTMDACTDPSCYAAKLDAHVKAKVATLEETGLNSPFDLSELFTESWFAYPQALGGLSHIALFMQGNDQFEIADSELAFRHDVSPAAHTNPCASPRQAGRPHDWSLIPPGNDGQLKSVLYNPRPYLLQFDTLIEI